MKTSQVKICLVGGKKFKKEVRKAQEVKDQQAELDRRTKIEREAERLISQCRFEDAMELLAILD